MAKPLGATSFVSLTLAQLKTRLGGREDLPVKVSKGWLRAVDELFGNPAVAEDAPEDEAAAPDAERGTGVKIIED